MIDNPLIGHLLVRWNPSYLDMRKSPTGANWWETLQCSRIKGYKWHRDTRFPPLDDGWHSSAVPTPSDRWPWVAPWCLPFQPVVLPAQKGDFLLAGQLRQDAGSAHLLAGAHRRGHGDSLSGIDGAAYPPDSNRLVFLTGNGQTREIIVPMKFIPQTVAFIVNVSFHWINPPNRYNRFIFAHMPQAPDCHYLLYPFTGFSCPWFFPYQVRGHL